MNATRRKELNKAQGLVAEAAAIVRQCADDEQSQFEDMSEKAQEGDKGQQIAEDANTLSDLADTLEEADGTFSGFTAEK